MHLHNRKEKDLESAEISREQLFGYIASTVQYAINCTRQTR